MMCAWDDHFICPNCVIVSFLFIRQTSKKSRRKIINTHNTAHNAAVYFGGISNLYNFLSIAGKRLQCATVQFPFSSQSTPTQTARIYFRFSFAKTKQKKNNKLNLQQQQQKRHDELCSCSVCSKASCHLFIAKLFKITRFAILIVNKCQPIWLYYFYWFIRVDITQNAIFASAAAAAVVRQDKTKIDC